MIRLTFACGHAVPFKEGDTAPICPCGETRITRTNAPPPRFSGVCASPLKVQESNG